MTAKEKAFELYEAMFYKIPSNKLSIKELDKTAANCALIAVDEILIELEQLRKPEYTTFIQQGEMEPCDGYEKIAYWQQVKKEISKI